MDRTKNMSSEVVEIVVDTNPGENEVFQLLQQAEPDVVRRSRLDVGDIVLRANGQTMIIERKSNADMAASITDGRLKEQKGRQLAAVAQDATGKTSVVYIVDGQLTPYDMQTSAGFPVWQLECAIVKTAIRDGIPVLRVPDKKSLADVVAYMFREMRSGELDLDAKAQQRAAAPYADISVKKAKNVTVQVMWRMVLATVPGMSLARASSFAESYPGPAAVFAATKNLEAKKAVKLIAATDTGNKKLGPKVAERIVELFRL